MFCHITYHEIVSVEACENFQHQYPVLDHNHHHTKRAVQHGQVYVWVFDSTFHLYIEMLLNSVLPHSLRSWHSASSWQHRGLWHQHSIMVESSDGSVSHNTKEDTDLLSCQKVYKETVSVLDCKNKTFKSFSEYYFIFRNKYLHCAPN